MREIKFRAWHKRTKVMIPDIQDTYDGLTIRGDSDFIYSVDLGLVDAFCSYLDNPEVEIMQYTGLKDKNGKDVYADDLFKSFKGVIFQVIWADSLARWAGVTRNIWTAKPKYVYKSLPWVIKHGDLCGNIYENPELLKVA